MTFARPGGTHALHVIAPRVGVKDDPVPSDIFHHTLPAVAVVTNYFDPDRDVNTREEDVVSMKNKTRMTSCTGSSNGYDSTASGVPGRGVPYNFLKYTVRSPYEATDEKEPKDKHKSTVPVTSEDYNLLKGGNS